jgi:hypothetical protein
MACQIQTDKYTGVVLDLIRLEPTVYNNFDNAASFILRSGLTPEQKMLSVHNLAHIYAGLADLDSSYYEKGRADQVSRMIAATENPEGYVQTLSELYGISRPAELKIDSITKKIEALGGKSVINRSDLVGTNGIVTLIKNYFATHSFANLEERTQLLEQLSAALRQQILDSQMPQDNKDGLESLIGDMFASLDKRSDFIPITEIAQEAQLRNVLVTLANGEMVEAISENEVLYMISNDGSLEALSEDQIVSVKQSRPTDTFQGNSSEHIFYEDTILSSLRVKPVNPEDTAEILKALNHPQPLSMVRIHAVKVSSVGDQRVERIQNLAQSDPAMAKLANRQHETFENKAQTAYLLSESNGKVVTLSRPKASEQSFVLVGSIIGTDKKFYLYSNDNLTFVSSDNTTERVDFNNPGHLAELKRLSVKTTGAERVELTDQDIETLQDSAKSYQEFVASVQDDLMSEFAGGKTSVDITEQFAQAYQMQSTRPFKTLTPLGKKLESDPSLYRLLTVVNTKTGAKEERQIPFLYNRVQGVLTNFQLVDILDKDERIEHTPQPGAEPVLMNMDDYAKEVLGLNPNSVEKLLKSTDRRQMNVVIKFREGAIPTYNIAENVATMSPVEEFANFIFELNKVLTNSTNRATDVKNFDVSQYAFKPATSKSVGDKPLYVAFSTTKEEEGRRLQFWIKAARDGRYSFMEENKRPYNFLFDEKIITTTAKALSEGKLVKQIQEKFPELAKFDLSKAEDLYEFYRTITVMSRRGSVDGLIIDLANAVKEARERFSQQIRDQVLNKLESQTSEDPRFMQNLREDFTYNGVFKPEFLFFREEKDGTVVPNISFSPRYTPKNGINARARFGSNLNNYMHVDSGARRFVITPKNSVSNLSSISAPAPAPVTVETPVQIHVQNPVQQPVTPSTIDIPRMPMFSMMAANVETETDAERLSAVAWLKKTYPQFQLSESDLSTLIELSSLDGTVLGMFKDRVIYLNNQIKGKGTVYHEAFHGVFRYLMTDAYRAGLVDLVSGMKAHASKFTEKSLKEFARKRNYVYDRTRMKQLQAEEILAEGFQKYMTDNKKPKGILGDLMQLLKRLIEMFTGKSNEIDRLYSRVSSGYYTGSVMASEMYDGQAAYEIIEGLVEIENLPGGVGITDRIGSLNSAEQQNELVNMVTYYMLKGYNDKQTFEQNFDRMAKVILDKEYNLDRLIDKYPKKRDQILEVLGNTWKNYRFMLGARMLGEVLPDLNNTGNPDYDNLIRHNSVKRNDGTGDIFVDNTNGQESKKTLMKLVKANFEKINALIEGKPEQDDTLTGDKIDELITDENPAVYNEDDETGSNDQETESADFDSGLNQYNKLEGVNKEIRRFLALVKYDRLDERLAGTVKPTIDLSREWSGDLESSDVYTEGAVNTMRTKAAKPNEHFGNPWSEGGYAGTIKAKSENGIPAVTVASNNYKEWLLGTKFQEVKPEQRNWILDQINQGKLDNAVLLYSKKLMDRGQGSHTISLAEVVDKIRGIQGVILPRLVNGNQMFGVLMSVTSDIEVDNIIDHIKVVAKTARYDGNNLLADDLDNIYSKLQKLTNMDSNGRPQSNLQLYNMMIDALDTTELDFITTTVYTDKKTDQFTGEDIGVTTGKYTIKDQVLFQDSNLRKTNIITSIKRKHASSAKDEAYIEAVRSLYDLAKNKIYAGNYILDSAGSNQGKKLEEISTQLHTLMGEVGINVPKSLIRLSLLAIDKIQNNVVHDDAQFSQDVLDHYNNHEQMIAEGIYFEKDFFLSISQILQEAITNTNNHDAFARYLTDDKKADLPVARFSTILRRAAAYIVKYDPQGIQSTIKDSENKSRYRFVSYTPALRLAQTLRRKGLEETLREDPYFEQYLNDWFKDNPAMGVLLDPEGNATDKAKQEMFLRNFRVAMFGGVNQVFDGKFKPGKSFKNIDSRSMYITHLLSFLNRTSHKQVIKDAEGKEKIVEIQTYLRSFTQLESSQTNFLISALYEQYADKKGMLKTKDGHLKITDTLTDVVRQEYNRIQRVYNARLERKQVFDAGEKHSLILKFSATHQKDDVTKAEVDSKDLRAYNFVSKMPDFFQANAELVSNDTNTGLRDFAFAGTKFEELPEDVLVTLRNQLNAYAQQALQRHIDRLVELQVLKKETRPARTPTGAAYIQTGTDGTITRYTSEFVAPTMIVDGRKQENVLENKYYKTPKNYGEKLKNSEKDVKPIEIPEQENMEGFVADAFFNFWANSLTVNDLLDGDSAMNIKDPSDYFKRQKKQLAAGSTLKRGEHKVAYINTIKAFIHESYPMYGPYFNEQEIRDDEKLSEDLRNVLLTDFAKAQRGVKETITDPDTGKETTIKYGDMMREIFDGQSFSTLMHQMDMHDAMGRLSAEAAELLIAKHYRKLTAEEISLLERNNIVNNAKKTVTSSRNAYHKQSEVHIDRNDVSVLVIPQEVLVSPERKREYIKKAQDTMHMLYAEVYFLRDSMQQAKLAGLDPAPFMAQIQANMQEVHKYYKPIPSRKMLHDLLNAMEFHQIDHLMDTAASKNATLLPVDIFAETQKLSEEGYINLEMSSVAVDNRYKFLQVETSGIKDTAKFSVQAKALIAADLANIAEIMRASGREITESEQKSMKKVATILRTYQRTLKDVGESNLINLKTILRKDGDFEVGKIFTLIRTSLESQGAPVNTLKLFDLNVDGTPVHSPNLPGIRNMLEYYFFSQYSKHITDEKRSGFKSIHMSSFGYDLMTDIDGNIIRSEDYRRNPDRYPNVKTRPLGVSVETNADGTKTYFVEAIVPKPQFRNKEHEEFYMKQLTKMFATRIPTEDKRSMIVLKVVDFIDSANLNSIIVPHFVHLLAGSDFDVDSLYGQTFAHYFNADDKPVLYGDYSAYSSEDAGRYTEFVEYMSKDDDASMLVKSELSKIEALGESYKPSDNAKTLVGYTAERLSEDTDTLKKYDAVLAAFEKLGLPVTLENFLANPKYKKVTRPAFQNANLRSMMDILSNEAVFNHLYINERSSVQAFEDIAEEFGRDVKQMGGGYNHLSIDGVVTTKNISGVYKSGIGIAANINKFVALASQFGLELNSQNVIWQFQNAVEKGKTETGETEYDLTLKKYTNFSTLSDENQRVIASIGNILGMFADGMKKPIPSALGMNEENVGVTLVMIGLGLSPTFAVGFNFLPEVRKAVEAVQAAKYAINNSDVNTSKFLNSEVKNQIAQLIKDNETAFEELKDAGLISSLSTSYSIALVPEKIALTFKAQKLDDKKVNSNTLTAKEIGFEVKAVNEKENTLDSLSEEAQRIILLKYYADQAQQQFKVQRAGSILNTFKKLNPRFVTFDKLLQNMRDLSENSEESIFTTESVSKIFEDEQVFKYLFEAMQDLDEQSSKLFLERTGFFAPVKQLFEQVFEDKSTIAKIITSYVALRQYQRLMPGSRTTGVEAIDNILAQDDKNLQDTFKAEYFFTNNLKDEVEQMLGKYPDNKFLQLLVSESGDASAFNEKNVKVPEQGLKLVTKANISGSYATSVTDDAYTLMIKENLFVKKLFYHELAKTGLMYKSGAFLQLLPTEMMRPFSVYINDFVKALETTKGNPAKLMNAVKSFLGNEPTDADVYNFFDEVFMLMANAASQEVNNNKVNFARRFSFAKESNLIRSFKFSETTTDRERLAIVSSALMHFMGQAPKDATKGYTPTSRNAANEVIGEITLDMSKPVSIPEVSENTMTEIGKNLGIRPVFGKPGVYKFPLMFKVDSRQGSVTYLLQGVGEQVGYQNFGESMFRSITGTGASSVEGNIAKYKAIPAVVSTGLMSPIGMPKQEIEKYVAYTTNKAKLPVVTVAAPAPVAKPQSAQVKPGVAELFESNPELANAVYEALGYKSKYKDAAGIGNLIDELKEIKEPYLKELADLFISLNIDIPLYYSKSQEYAFIVPDNTIIIPKNSYGIIKQKSIIHELLHGGTSNKLLSNPNFKSEIESLIKTIKDSDQQGSLTFSYELQSADELISGLSEKSFVNFLKQKGIYDNVLSVVKNNLEFKTGFQITPQQKQQAQQLYSQYLDTIFPDSQVKDIVYHLSNAQFEKFDKKFISTNTRDFDSWLGFFFTTDKNKFKELLKSRNLEWKQEYPAILNIKKGVKESSILSTKFSHIEGMLEKSQAYRNYKKSLIANNNDGIISPSISGANNITVFESEQIHILGSKQDIEGLKSFVNSLETVQAAPAQASVTQVSQEDMTGMQDATDMLMNMMSSTPAEQQTELDMNNLNLTQPVVDYLYSQSSKRLSKDNFRQAAAAMIANLRASTPTDQILEKIKCL